MVNNSLSKGFSIKSSKKISLAFDHFVAISSLDNEENIWEDAIQNARTRDEAAAAEGILEIVKGINAELK